MDRKQQHQKRNAAKQAAWSVWMVAAARADRMAAEEVNDVCGDVAMAKQDAQRAMRSWMAA